MSQKYYKHSSAILDDGVTIGEGTKIWHWTHICGQAIIGSNCVFGQNVFIANKVKVGNRVKVQNNVSIYDNIILEDDVFCGPSIVFTNVINPRAHIERKDEYKLTHVQNGATLGANCTIICGNIIGAYALIGAGSVITKDVKPHALMVGVPAKQISWVSHAGEILKDDLICPREKKKYKIINDELVEL